MPIGVRVSVATLIAMKTSRRYDSLIPLSHDHHHALVLCLRIHRGLELHREDEGWLQATAEEAIRFFASDLTPHITSEEEVLFPAMQYVAESSELICELLREHRAIENLVERLRQMNVALFAETLQQLADLLETHIRKEERAFSQFTSNVFQPTSLMRSGKILSVTIVRLNALEFLAGDTASSTFSFPQFFCNDSPAFKRKMIEYHSAARFVI